MAPGSINPEISVVRVKQMDVSYMSRALAYFDNGMSDRDRRNLAWWRSHDNYREMIGKQIAEVHVAMDASRRIIGRLTLDGPSHDSPEMSILVSPELNARPIEDALLLAAGVQVIDLTKSPEDILAPSVSV